MHVTGFVSPLAGIYVTRYGARKSIAVGGILCVLCFVVAGFHTQLWQLYLAYAVLFGLGGSLCGMLSMTTIVNNWFVNRRPLAILSMLLLIIGMAVILWAKTLPIILIYNFFVGIGMGGVYVAIMNLMPLYFGKSHYPKIIGISLPFFAILGSLGSPITGWIRDITGSYTSAWKLAILILIIGLIFLILARPPMHPSLREKRANSI